MSSERPSGSQFLWVPLVIIIAVGLAALRPWEERGTPPVNRVSVESGSKSETSGTGYLDEYCRGYKLSLQQAAEEIDREMTASAAALMNGLIEKRNEHAQSAASIIHSVRLCGGLTVEQLGLRPSQLGAIGILPF